ncbi:MAG TPA: hypothetical protein VFU22_07785 [Roseiflexaceae bacterium]|nr:hypothetical protein [Roseiflexaceae bacterium]
MAITRTYSDSASSLAGEARVRLGGPRSGGTSTAREERIERFMNTSLFGSHMPLDTDAHWDWRNPLNIIPAAILLVSLIALVATIVSIV